MELDELAREGQPAPRACVLLFGRSHLSELLEDRLLILGRDADPGIRYGNLRGPVLRARGDVNPTPLRGELQGVGQEIQEHLLDLALVPPKRPQALVARGPQG